MPKLQIQLRNCTGSDDQNQTFNFLNQLPVLETRSLSVTKNRRKRGILSAISRRAQIATDMRRWSPQKEENKKRRQSSFPSLHGSDKRNENLRGPQCREKVFVDTTPQANAMQNAKNSHLYRSHYVIVNHRSQT